MSTCHKCHRGLRMCEDCDGGRRTHFGGRVTCTTCRNSGEVCLEHGGFWK